VLRVPVIAGQLWAADVKSHGYEKTGQSRRGLNRQLMNVAAVCPRQANKTVESASLSSGSEDGIMVLVVGLGNIGIVQSGGNVIDGGIGALLHGSRHV
jgi:hypothetical protein